MTLNKNRFTTPKYISMMTLASVTLVQLFLGPSGYAQQQKANPGNPPKLVKLSRATEHISLSVNQSLALEFTQPVKKTAIANDQIASISVVSPKLVLVTGKSFGFTQLVLWDEAGGQYVYDIRVDVDMRRLEKTLRDAAPTAKVRVSSILDTVVLAGVVPDAPTAARLVALANVFARKVNNQLQTAGIQQVLLRATVAEISRKAVRTLGLNGAFFGAKAFGGSNLDLINPTSIGLQGGTAVPIDPPNHFQIMGSLGVAPTSTLYFGLPRTQMELFLKAMQENSLLRVLAEPNLIALSGQQAEFLAGGEFPVPTPSEDGLTITFREFGVRLKFRPVVQAGQIIRITVTSEVSEPDFTNAVQIAGLTIPGLNTRRTQTVVEVGSGHTFAIAGLLSESIRGIVNKIPGIGSLPILGALFRSVNYERSESELIVLVTPELASPLTAEQVSYIPGQNVFAPNDWQLYGLGLLQDDTAKGTTTQPAQAPRLLPGPLYGPWGPSRTDARGGNK